MKRFLGRTSLLFSAFLAIGYFLYFYLFPQLYVPFSIVALIFIYFLTNLVHYFLLKIADKSINKFNALYMSLNFGKMFIYLIFAVGFVFFHREDAKIFLVNFLVFYIAFSILEIFEITRVVKSKS